MIVLSAINPLGVGNNIRLTWNYSNTGKRNETQSAFQIFLDSTEDKFDSGIIKSNSMDFNLIFNLR